MANNKWVEVEARSIDDAIKAGLSELNLDDATQANINILREPEGGVFGVGGTKALVRVRIESSNSKHQWSTIGVSHNVVDASYVALHDSITYHLLKS